MKKRCVAIILMTALLISGCGPYQAIRQTGEESVQETTEQTYEVEPYDICFTLPDGWEKVTGETPYDMQFSKDERYYMSVFAYKSIDLGEGVTSQDIYEMQKEELINLRDNMKPVAEKKNMETEDKYVYTELYSGEKDHLKNYYYCCLVEFKAPRDGFAWVLFSGVPTWVDNDLEELDQILLAAEYKE